MAVSRATSTIAGSDWTVSGAFIAEGFDYFIDTNPADAQSGTHSFAGGAIGGLGFISQHIATAIGMNYNIHLWLANLSGFADNTAIQVLWGGNVVYSAADIPGFGYNEIVIDPIATSTSTTLSIGLQDDSFFLNVGQYFGPPNQPNPRTGHPCAAAWRSGCCRSVETAPFDDLTNAAQKSPRERGLFFGGNKARRLQDAARLTSRFTYS